MMTAKDIFSRVSVCILWCSTTASATTLETEVSETLQKSPDMAGAIQQYYASKADMNIATGGFLPRLDLLADAGKEVIEPKHVKDTTRDRSQARLRMSAPVFKGFANVNEYDRASSSMKSSYYKSLSKAESITLSLTKGYIDLLSARDVIVMSEENLLHHQKTYDLILKRANQGISNKADLSQIKSRLARAKANMVAARSNYNDAKIHYIQIAGVLPEDLERPQVDRNYLPKNRQRVLDIAFANHQVLRSSQCDTDAAISASKMHNAHYYPEFDVVAEKEWKDDVGGANGHVDEWRVLLEMKWNLFAGGQKSSAHKKALFQEEASRMTLNGVRRALKANVDSSWNAYEKLEEEVVYLKEYVEENKKIETLYEQQFKADRRSLLDLLDSQNEFFQSRKAYISADYDYLYAQYRVIASMSYILDALHVNVMKGLIDT